MEHFRAKEVVQVWSAQFRHYFDVTLGFEQMYFVFISSAILIFCKWYSGNRADESRKVAKFGQLFWAKVGLGVILTIAQTSEVVAVGITPTLADTLGIGTSSASCLATACVLAAVFLEHFYRYRPSVFLSAYLTITVLFDIVRVRPVYLQDIITTGVLAVVGVGSKLALVMILEDVPRRLIFLFKEMRRVMNRCGVAGLWIRAIVISSTTTFLRGYRMPQSLDDIDDLDGGLQAEQALQTFQQHWNKDPTARFAVIWTCIRTFGTSRLFVGEVASYLYLAGHVAHIFLVKFIVGAMDSKEDMDSGTGNRIIAATIAVYGLIAAFRAIHRGCTASGVATIRTGLIGAIYDKVLHLDGSDATKKTAMALITTDIQGIQYLVRRISRSIYGIWSIISGIVYLFFNLGPQTILSLSPMILLCLITGALSARITYRFREWSKKTEDRVNITHNFLTNMKSIRMTGLAPVFEKYIRQAFVAEVDASKRYRHVHSLAWTFEFIALALSPILVMYSALFWSKRNAHLSKAEVYAALSAAFMIAEPVGDTVHSFALIATISALNDRIQAFLLREPHVDVREKVNQVSSADGSVPTTDSAEHLAADVQHLYSRPALNGRQILQDVHASFPPKKLTMVLGSVGSGKSTLLKVLIGQVSIAQGRMFINSDQIGYCGQTAWIRNQPVKNCIIGPADICETWYRKVIHACCLDADFQSWQQGDATIAGNNGSNLSGGQKQRVALARALYSRKSILVLDDLFSGLDKETTEAIFKNVFGAKGLLRETGSTAIVATNLIEYVKYADVVLQFDEDGTLERVDKTSGLIPARHLGLSTGISSLDKTQDPIVYQDVATTSRALDRESENQLTLRIPEVVALGSKPVVRGNGEDARAWKRKGIYRSFLSSFGKWHIALWMFWIAVGEVLFKGSYIYLRFWFEVDEEVEDYFIRYAAIAISSVISSALSVWVYFIFLIPTSYKTWHNRLLESTINAATHFFSIADVGDLVNRFSQDMFLVSQDLPFALMYSLMFFFAIATVLAIIISVTTYMAPAVSIFVLFMIGVLISHARTSRQVYLLQTDAVAPLYTLLDETTSGIDEIRAFQWQVFMKREFLSFLTSACKPFYLGLHTEQWLLINMDCSVGILAALMVTLVVKTSSTNSANAVGIAMLSLIGLSKETLSGLVYWGEMEAFIGAVARILFFAETTPQEPSPPPKSKEVHESWPQYGRIVFKKMAARFDGSKPNTPTILRDVNTTIEPGFKVGVVGRSGSGKSSLLMTALQMLHYDGTIQIDGVELRTVHPEIVRDRITSIPQDPVLLPGTVRHNLHPWLDKWKKNETSLATTIVNALPKDSASPSSPATPSQNAASRAARQKREIKDEDLVDILKKLQLWEYVERHGGLDKDVESLELSDGQCMLLTLGRGMIHHLHTGSKITLMDEITSQVDYDTEQRIQVAIKEVFKDCTLLIVSHREQTLQDADFLLKIADGRVVELFPAPDEGIASFRQDPSWLGANVHTVASGRDKKKRVLFEAREPLLTPEERAVGRLEAKIERTREHTSIETRFRPREKLPGSPTGTARLDGQESSNSEAPDMYEGESLAASSSLGEGYSLTESEQRELDQERAWTAEMQRTDEEFLMRRQENAAAMEREQGVQFEATQQMHAQETAAEASAQPAVASGSRTSSSSGFYQLVSTEQNKEQNQEQEPEEKQKQEQMTHAQQGDPVDTKPADKGKNPSSSYSLLPSEEEGQQMTHAQQDNSVEPRPAKKRKDAKKSKPAEFYSLFSSEEEERRFMQAQPNESVHPQPANEGRNSSFYSLHSSEEERQRTMQAQQDDSVDPQPAVNGKNTDTGKVIENFHPLPTSIAEAKIDIKDKGKAVAISPSEAGPQLGKELSPGFSHEYDPAGGQFRSDEFPVERGTFAEHAYAVALDTPTLQIEQSTIQQGLPEDTGHREDASQQVPQQQSADYRGDSNSIEQDSPDQPGHVAQRNRAVRPESKPEQSESGEVPNPMPEPPSPAEPVTEPVTEPSSTLVPEVRPSAPDPMPGPSSMLDTVSEPSPSICDSMSDTSSISDIVSDPGPSSARDMVSDPGPSSASDIGSAPAPGPSRLDILKQELRATQLARRRAREAAMPYVEPRIADEDLPLIQARTYQGNWSSERPSMPKKNKKPKKKKRIAIADILPDLDQLKL